MHLRLSHFCCHHNRSGKSANPLVEGTVMRDAPLLTSTGQQLERGAFLIPHWLFDTQLKLTAHEKLFMVVLNKCENRYAGRTEEWFYVSDRKMAKLCGCSFTTLLRTRQSVVRHGFIQVEKGNPKAATRYLILQGSAKAKSE